MEVSMDTVDEDRLSSLPSCILDLILSFLPAKDVLRTSVLSTKWRYQWTTVPKLVFVEDFSRPSMINGESRRLARMINHVLLLHTGSIEVLHIINLSRITNIDHWIISVSRRNIKEFVFKVYATQYTLHSSLYNCQSLVSLLLARCILRPPSYIPGWKSLKSLYLENVTLFDGNPYENDDALENMISCCPMLEALSLVNVAQFGNLHINAQNLRYLYITGFYHNITLGCTLPKLLFLLLDYIMLRREDDGPAYKENSFTEFFINLPHIYRLTLKQRFMKYLTTAGTIPEKLPFLLNDLRRLKIYFCIDEQGQSLAALCLFKSSPRLRDIEITIRGSADLGASIPNIWKCSGKSRCIFEKLRYVTIHGMRKFRVDLALLEFILAESPVLEKVTIAGSAGKELFLRKCMLKFKRASAEAKVVFG